MKWFSNIRTLDDLRKLYRKLAFENHPDRGGVTATMQEINNEYDTLSKYLINGNLHFTETRKTYEHEVSKQMRVKVDEILNLPGIMIEIMGSWIWVTGNTYPVKNQLKDAGFLFSHNKVCWYWHCGEYFKKSKKKFSLDDIRTLWGSEEVNNSQSQKSSFLS
ncbi:MAG: J domain-containing protein [Bacteroidota bacterium]